MDISKYKPNGTFWSPQEDEELNNMYNEKLMDIIEISNIINRTPDSIISRNIELKNDVKEIKNEIKEIKNKLKELIEMMKAVY